MTNSPTASTQVSIAANNMSPAEELKQLLLGQERLEIEQIKSRLGQLVQRIETPEERAVLVADVLNEAIEGVDPERRERLVVLLSHLISKPVKREIKNSQPEILQAIYPVADQLISQGIKNAMDKLQSSLNESLRRKFSLFQSLKLTLRSLISGKSKAELWILDNPEFHIETLMLIERGTGLIIASSSKAPEVTGQDEEQKVAAYPEQERLAGLLSALEIFAKDILRTRGDDDGDLNESQPSNSLRHIEADDRELFLASSPRFSLVAHLTGHAPKFMSFNTDLAFQNVIKEFGSDLCQQGANLDMGTAEDLTERLEIERVKLEDTQAKPPMCKARKMLIMGAVSILLFGFYLWLGLSFWQMHMLNKLESALRTDEILAPYVLFVDRWDGKVSIRGTVDSEEQKQRVYAIARELFTAGDFDLNLHAP